MSSIASQTSSNGPSETGSALTLPGLDKLPPRAEGLPPDRLIAALSASLTHTPQIAREGPSQPDVELLPVPVSRARRSDGDPDGDWLFSPVVTGALVGLGLGLVLMIGMFIASGGIETARLAPASDTALARMSPGPAVPRRETGSEESQLNREAFSVAKRMIAGGDLAGARDILARAASSGSPEAVLALAETFDPHVLAAWGVREGAADPGLARELYARAADAGILRARQRLEALE